MFNFDQPSWLIVGALVGAILLWSKETPGRLRVYYLSDLFDHVPKLNETARYFLQLAIFLGIGTVVSLWLTNPQHVQQAFAAGLGWTAGLSTGQPKRSRAQERDAI